MNDNERAAAEPASSRAVIITGAGSGIGAATALHLDRLGWQVFAGVHDAADGEVLARQASARMQVAQLDVTDETSVEGFCSGVQERLGSSGLAALVNSVGEGIAGPLERLPIDSLRHQLDVNVIGQVLVTQYALPLLRRGQAGGRVVFVGSMGGLVGVQFAAAHDASKYPIEAIWDAWRQELAPDGIHVAIVEPGPISTPLWAKAARTLDALPANRRYQERVDAFRETLRRQSEDGASPQSIAELIEHAVSAPRPRTRYAAGLAATVTPKLRRLLPDRLFDNLARGATTKPE